MRAGLKRGFSVPRATLDGPRRFDRRVPRRRCREERLLQAVRADARDHPGGRAAGAARGGRSGDPRSGACPPIASCSTSFATNICRRRARRSRRATCPTATPIYRAQIREYTTLDLTPEEIHQIGPQGSRADRRRDAARRCATAASRASSRSSSTSCKTDPQFCAKTPDELLGVSAYVAKRIDGKSSATISGCCRAGGSGSSRCPTRSRPSTPSGRGGLENCHDEHLRSAEPAALQHPGADAARMRARATASRRRWPRSRRRCRASASNIYFSGYGEGWGLYSRMARQRDGHLPHALRDASASRATRCGARRGW